MGERRSKKRKEVRPETDPEEGAGKKSKVAAGADAVEDPNQLAGSVAISNDLLKKQKDVQQEKQRKIAEANKAIKREKRKNRVKKNKPLKNATTSPATTKKTTPEYAMNYVQQWKEDNASWKFQTLVQSWILQNILDDSKISKADFPLVLEYAGSVRGAARRRLSEEMRAVVEARDRWPSLRAEGQSRQQARDTIGRDKPSKRAYRRARSLLQSLDDDDE